MKNTNKMRKQLKKFSKIIEEKVQEAIIQQMKPGGLIPGLGSSGDLFTNFKP